MTTYLALLRGVNVGGKGMIKMAELRDALAGGGLSEVKTYIQSGNVIFSSGINDTDELSALIKSTIRKRFGLDVDVAVFTRSQWKRIIDSAPGWWGADSEWKHNLLMMIKPYKAKDVIAAIGDLKPDIEAIEPGRGVLYQSLSVSRFGRTNSSKLVGKPVYKKITIRSYSTANKLQALLAAR